MSVVEDFDDIAARLKQIEQEKTAAGPTDQPVTMSIKKAAFDWWAVYHRAQALGAQAQTLTLQPGDIRFTAKDGSSITFKANGHVEMNGDVELV
jgi:hypothetical protein